MNLDVRSHKESLAAKVGGKRGAHPVSDGENHFDDLRVSLIVGWRAVLGLF